MGIKAQARGEGQRHWIDGAASQRRGPGENSQRAAWWPALTASSALMLAACSGVGEFEITSAESTVTFVSATFPASETLGSGSVVVALATTLPETTKEIRATVSDLGTGSATSGTDYAAFDPVVVTFPVGSVTGDTVSVSVTPLIDTVAEGADETIRLGLTQASNASIIGITQTNVEIDDAHTASLSFDSGATVTPDESSNSYSLTVTLDVTAGGTLGFDVDALIQDDGTGSASSGDDYAAIPSTPVQFSAGTASGASQT
ncbi:MAG: Calx-beta domain-containing protein, partial [Planctomycetota bacterium]